MNLAKAIGTSLQGTALFLVVFGTCTCLVGCWRDWAELKTLGASIAGAGVQSITSQVRNILRAEDGATVNLNPQPQPQS